MTDHVVSSVIWGRRMQRQLLKVPPAIAKKFYAWASEVEQMGIRAVRRRPGYHDEPLLGERFGQRSVRLNRSWRAIYRESKGTRAVTVEVIEITPHDY